MASMRDIKRRNELCTEYTADYESDEAGIHCKAAKGKGRAGEV